MPLAVQKPQTPDWVPSWLKGLLGSDPTTAITPMPIMAAEQVGSRLAKPAIDAMSEELPQLGRAAKEAVSPALQGLKSAAQRMLNTTSETRLSELYKKFGGLGK